MASLLRHRVAVNGNDGSHHQEAHDFSNENDSNHNMVKTKHITKWKNEFFQKTPCAIFYKILALVVFLSVSLVFGLVYLRIFVLFHIDLSLGLHILAKYFQRCDGWHYQSQIDTNVMCTVDLCVVAHEGGEGILFPAQCHNSSIVAASPIPAFHKYIKIASLKTAYHEISSTQVMSQCHDSPLHVWDGGLNFLTVTRLEDYKKLDTSSDASFINAYLNEIGNQLSCLHRGGYLHRDVYNSNILISKKSLGHPRRFQLIDMSSSTLMTVNRDWESSLKSSLHGAEKQHIPIPPMLICRLPQLTHEEQKYCQHVSRPCLVWYDRYSLGVQALRMFAGSQIGKSPVQNPLEISTWTWRKQQYQRYKLAIEDLQMQIETTGGKGTEEGKIQLDLLQRIHQLVLFDNHTESCH